VAQEDGVVMADKKIVVASQLVAVPLYFIHLSLLDVAISCPDLVAISLYRV